VAQANQPARDRAPYTIHALIIILGFLALLWIDRQRWFFVDDWVFLTHYDGIRQQSFSLSTPFNLHWVSGSYLFYNAMYALVGLHSYLPYLALGLALHILTVNLLWRMMLASGVDVWTATALSLLTAMFGAGWELLNWAIIVGGSGTFALDLLALSVASSNMKQLRRDLIMVICLTAGLMFFTELGILMLLPCSLAICLRRGWREMTLVIATPLAAYGLWFASKGAAAVYQTVFYFQPHLDLASVPPNVLGGIAGSIAAGFGVYTAGVGSNFALLIGGAIAAVLIGTLWKDRRYFREQLRCRLSGPIALAIVGVAYFFMVSIEHEAPPGSLVGRYFYYGWLLFTPIVGVAISRLLGQDRLKRLVFLALTCVCAASSTSLLVMATADYTWFDSPTKGLVLAASALVRDGSQSILLPPSQGLNSTPFLTNITVNSLKKFVADGALDASTPPDPAMTQLAALFLQTSVSGNPIYASSGTVRPIAGNDGRLACESVASGDAAYLLVSAPQSISIRTSAPLRLTLSPPSASVGPLFKPTYEIPAGSTYLNSTVVGTIQLSGSRAFAVCSIT
jgi:hypothetical protein